MRIRNVLQEYEATLAPGPASDCPAAQGKAEWKAYDNGTRQGRVSVSRLALPDGAVLELVVGDQRIAQLTVQRGSARYKRATDKGEGVPVIEKGQVLQVIHAGQVILAGQFYVE